MTTLSEMPEIDTIQPFWRNFYFLNKIFFFIKQLHILFEFLFKNRMQ
jgi:hypothetical protein